MSKPLWGGRFSKPPAEEAMEFSKSIDVDRRLWDQDLRATYAHGRALLGAGILSEHEFSQIAGGLERARQLFEDGTFELSSSDEDIHSAIERFLIEELGDTGAKIHAGRSRNDLVATDLRLWVKDACVELAAEVHELIKILASRAQQHAKTLAPGFTHLQRAQPIFLGHHLLAHCFALCRDFDRLLSTRTTADVSPLGAAAFAGTSIPTDPESIARELGFSAVFDNAADAVSSRDFAVEFVAACAMCATHLSRLGEEIVYWTTAEFGFAELDDAYATGSSIMPNKKNPDVAELTRARSSRILGHLVSLLGMLKALPLTYDRDLQEDKVAVFGAFDTLAGILAALKGLMSTISFDTQALASAAGGFTTATSLAEWLVVKGVPFREAHKAVGSLVAHLQARGNELQDATIEDLTGAHKSFEPDALRLTDPKVSAESMNSHGGTSSARITIQLEVLQKRLESQAAQIL